jgi:hypothetical protein
MLSYRLMWGAPLALAACFAHAQEGNASIFSDKPLWISGGLSELIGPGGEFTTTTGFIVGAGYHFKALNSGFGTYSPSLDFTWASNSGRGARVDSLALLAAVRVPITGASFGRGNVPYYGLGVGVVDDIVIGRTVETGTSGGGSSGGTPTFSHYSSNDWTFAARALVGVSFAERYFAEAAYSYYGSPAHTTDEAISLTVGVRF